MLDKKGRIYETLLNIARSADGRKILYALSNTKKVDDGEVFSASKEEELAHNDQLSLTTISQKDNVVNSNISENEENDTIESEVNEDEQERSNSLSGDSGRRGNGGSGERIRRVSENERRNQGRDEEERRSFARELREQGKVQTVTEKIGRYTYRYDVVSPESYNDDMLSMIAEAAEKGIELGFFVGNGNVNYDSKGDFKIEGIKVSGSKILVQYDAKTSPQKIAKHEIVHAKWKTTEIKNIQKQFLVSFPMPKRKLYYHKADIADI